MTPHFHPAKHLRILLIGWLFCTQSVFSCTIPVFRYALDRWHADTFALDVPDALLEEIEKTIGPLRNNRSLNLRLNPAAEGAKPDHIALIAPANREQAVWSGKYDPKTLTTVLDSPARREIMKRIVAGESAVWVMVESGDKAKDDEAAGKLAKRLKYLNSVASIPPQDPFDPESQLGPGPKLRVEFSVLRVNGADPAEQPFVNMLAGPKVEELVGGDEPYASPVFGRGRVLGTWKCSEIHDEDVDDLCLFMLGACSCQVKQQNPGWDLLINADWDGALMKAQEQSVAEANPEPLPKLEEINVPQPEEVMITGQEKAAPEPLTQPAPVINVPAVETRSAVSVRQWMLLGSFALVIVAGFILWPGRLR